MPQTQDTTPHPVTVYRHGADLSLCYPLMWNVTLEYTATHFNVLGETRPGNPSPTFHTHQRTLNLMVNSRKLSRKYRTNRVLNPGPVVCESSTLSARPQRLPIDPEYSMLTMPLSRWFKANLRPLVTSFRVNMWLQFDNKPSDIQIICNFKLYLYPDLFPSIIFDNVYVHSIT